MKPKGKINFPTMIIVFALARENNYICVKRRIITTTTNI
jgi:hypothetical protein